MRTTKTMRFSSRTEVTTEQVNYYINLTANVKNYQSKDKQDGGEVFDNLAYPKFETKACSYKRPYKNKSHVEFKFYMDKNK